MFDKIDEHQSVAKGETYNSWRYFWCYN